MSSSAANSYLRAKVLTASPQQLQLMLYDGAIRFAEQAKVAMEQKDRDGSYNALIRAQKIILELQCTLKHDVSPEVCGKLASLYTFCYMRLVEANVQHEIQAIDDAIGVLRYQRETWALLIESLGDTPTSPSASPATQGRPATAAIRSQRVPQPLAAASGGSGFSVQG